MIRILKPCSKLSTNRVQLLCITLDPLCGLGRGDMDPFQRIFLLTLGMSGTRSIFAQETSQKAKCQNHSRYVAEELTF